LLSFTSTFYFIKYLSKVQTLSEDIKLGITFVSFEIFITVLYLIFNNLSFNSFNS